ncbi:MAG TPA: hypothetical protein VGE17_03335 [Methylophilus sp.]
MKWFGAHIKKGRLGLSYTDKHVSLVVVKPATGGKPKIEMAQVAQVSMRNLSGMKSVISHAAIKSFPCNAVLNVEQYQIIQVDKPNMPDAEVKPALKWKIKELLDYQVENATVDGVDIPTDPANPNRLPFMFAVCAKNSQLAELSNGLLDAGVNLKSIDVHALVQRNVAALLEQDARVLVMVSMLERGCLVTFTAGGELYQTRLIELDRGFMMDLNGDLFNSNLDRLVLELQRSLDSFDRQFPYLTINRLLVAPDIGAERLVDVLKNSLYLPVESFSLADIVELPDDEEYISPEKQALLLPALGAALRMEGDA